MKISDKYRPSSLDMIVGQPMAHAVLFGWLQDPYSCCFMMRGAPGTGKTSSALALVAELDCSESYRLVPCSDLGIDKARELIRALALSPMFGGGRWNVLILEELERLSPACQQYLKVALESLPPRAVVMATSNDTALIDPALLQRFTTLDYGSGAEFAKSANLRLAQVWIEETQGAPLPAGFDRWGIDDSGAFSLRLAYDRMQQSIFLLRAGVSLPHDRKPAAPVRSFVVGGGAR